jgi:TolA-binding protein
MRLQEAKMKKILTSTFILFFLTLSAAAVFAQPPQRMMRGRRMFDRPHNRILAVLKANQEALDITDEQMEQVQTLVFSFQERSLKMQNEISMNQLELQKLMQDRENLDYDNIGAILSKTSAARNAMFIEGLKLRQEINSVLSPEQLEALKAITKNGIRSRGRFLQERMLRRFPRSRNRVRK